MAEAPKPLSREHYDQRLLDLSREALKRSYEVLHQTKPLVTRSSVARRDDGPGN